MVPQTEILTVMFIDIVNYTKTTSKLSREKFNQLHDVFDDISIKVFHEFQGNIIKKIGDAFLVTFKSATDAVLCGIKLQNTFLRYNKENKPKIPLRIRVALHAGEVIVRNKDVYGDAVNTAARIEGIAKANDIVFSESVYSTMNKNEVPYIYLGAKKMKGLKRPIRIFKVKSPKDKFIKIKKRNIQRKRKIKNFIINIVLWIFLLIVIIVTYLFIKNYF